MREMKFRVWDRKHKCFVRYHSFGGVVNPIKDTDNTILLSHFDGYVLMQYTGLKDKNGQEIYEGDILKLDSWSELQIVKFIEGAFCLVSVKEKYSQFASDIHYIHHAGIPQAQVIGNIKENPELLKGEAK